LKKKKNISCAPFILGQHLLAVVVAVCISTLLVGSSVQVSLMRNSYTYLVTPWNMDSSNFEESYIFGDILSSNIADAARMAVIRSQMETDGVYDPEKIVDVTAFVNRAGTLPEQYVTACYHLEDLLKWYKFGFVRNYTLIDENTFYAPVSTHGEPEAVLAEESAVTADAAVRVEDEVRNVYLEVLTCRYKTVDGKNIQDLVSNEEDYALLCRNIETAAESLYHNYEEYHDYLSYFERSNINFRYCLEMVVNGEQIYLSNLDVEGLTEGRITRIFKGMGRYLYYYPENMDYETNTTIEEAYLQQVLGGYEYAYPEATRVWMGVDTSYPVSDVYTQAVATYNKVLPVWWILVGVSAAGLVGYLVLLVIVTIRQGRDGETEGVCLKRIDRIPTELMLLLCLFCQAGVWFAVSVVKKLMPGLFIGDNQIIAISTALTVFTSVVFLLAFYSMVRRIKAKTLWQNSLIRSFGKGFMRLLRWSVKVVKKLCLLIIDHGPVIVRTLLPCVFLFFINFMGVYMFLRASMQEVRYPAMCALIAVDVLAAAYIIKTNMDREQILNGIEQICDGDLSFQIDIEQMHGGNRQLAVAVNHIGEGIRSAVETSIKDERLKAELITNVSHDLKTPLTSIINYVNLIKREQIDNEKVRGYVEILEQKSSRLKTLTEDLVEASKVSSGNVNLIFGKLNLVELMHQTIGEFTEKFEEKGLQVVATFGVPSVMIWVDSRRTWRVMENLFHNIYKYAMENTRVYIDLNVLYFNIEETGAGAETDKDKAERVEVSIKNISAQPLNIDAEQLTERFIRGDVSRSTEGSGLGLSIAKDLVKLQNGDFRIYLDGDLFKVTLSFPVWVEE